LLTAIIILLYSMSITLAQPVDATPTPSIVYVDGVQVQFDAYNIAGNNYFKLRDLAWGLSGTIKQFAVEWDAEANAIRLIKYRPYRPVGGEMSEGGGDNREAIPTTAQVYLDEQEIELTAYNIGGNNYFKLRDIGQAMDFGVIWDEIARCIRIESGQSYTPEDDIAEEEGENADTVEDVTVEIPEDAQKVALAALPPPATTLEEYAQEVVRIVNEERAKEGLAPLIADSDLFAAAQIRAEELPKKFSHNRPNGTLFNSVLKKFSIEYTTCAENIACGQNSPQKVMQSWMRSPGHCANILGNYTKIGVGVTLSSKLYHWEQIFI